MYMSPHYPHFCRTYKCKLLKQLLDETTSLPDALTVIQHAKGMIAELETSLPNSPNTNFRERLVAHLEEVEHLKLSDEEEHTDKDFRQKASALLLVYEKVFGVKDVVDKVEEENN